MNTDFELDGAFSLDGRIEAARLSVHLGDGHFSVSDASKKNPKRMLILYPFLQSMLSCDGTEYIGDGVQYCFSGNKLGCYQYQFRGEGDFRRVKEWSLTATYSKTNPLAVRFAGTTHPDVALLRRGLYDDGPVTTFRVEFSIPDDLLQVALGMNDIRFTYFLEWKEARLSELA